jgi:hypothetical protein
MPHPRREQKFVQPGDLLNVVRTLRTLMSSYDDARYVIDASFDHLSPELEGAATEMRSQTSNAARKLFGFLDMLESHPEVVALRKRALGCVPKEE